MSIVEETTTASKTKNDEGNTSLTKRPRKPITLEIKHRILTLHESGLKVNQLAALFNISHSSISTIIKDKNKYLDQVNSDVPMQSTVIRKRDSLLPEVEKALIEWLKRRSSPLTQTAVSKMALLIFKKIKRQRGEAAKDETFSASKGWFNRFKKRAGWQNLKAQREAAIADNVATPDSDKLTEMFEEEEEEEKEDHFLHEVFSTNETEQIPSDGSDGEGFQVSHDFLDLEVYSSEDELSTIDEKKSCNEDNTETVAQVMFKEEPEDQIEKNSASCKLTIQKLSEAFGLIESALNIFETDDPNFERSSKVLAAVRNNYACYREIYHKKQMASSVQNPLEYFFEKQPPNMISSTEQVQASSDSSCQTPLIKIEQPDNSDDPLK